MTPERHVWACAKTLITQHGEDAWFHASLRADALLEAGDLDGHNMFKVILARIEENATKLALIRAVSRDSVTPQIEDHDAHWGIALSRHCAELTIREASARVSENQVESNHKRALQILRDGDAAGMSKSEFTRRTQFMDHRQRDGVLRTLTDAHLVEVFAMPTGGRPSQWIKLAGNDVPTDQ